MSNLQCIKDIQVGFSKIGSRGVFAKKPFKKGQVIEEAPFIAVYKEHILGKMLDYVFDFDDHCYAVAFGYGSMYNSSPKNNAQYVIDTKQEGVLLFKAKKDIQKGEEITVNYGKEWFEGRGLIHQK